MKAHFLKPLLLTILVLVFALFLVTPSEAQKAPKLKGTYGFVGQDTCVAHWTKNPNGNLAPDIYWTKTTTIHGTTVFDSSTNNSTTTEGYHISITHPVYTPIPAESYWDPIPGNLPYGGTTTLHVTSSGSYEIDPATRQITRQVTSSGHFLSGTVGGHPAAGKTVESSAFKLSGYVSLDLGTIVLSSRVDDPDKGETYHITSTIYNPDGTVFAISEEVCQKTRILTQIK